MKMLGIGTDNHGYKVFAIMPHGDYPGEFVVAAENPQAADPFVTWETTEDIHSFYWGHYSRDRKAALADLVDRSKTNS